MSDAVEPRLFPLFADLRGRAVLVVGGGAVAGRKIAPLLAAGAMVSVVARDVSGVAQQAIEAGSATWLADSFSEEHLDAMWLVVVATSDGALNSRVAAAAEARRIWANVVDDVALSTYQTPAVVDRAPVQIAISSGGAAPVLARRIRERIEAMVDESIGPLAALMHRLRGPIRERFSGIPRRRRFLEQVSEGPVARFIAAGDGARAEQALLAALAAESDWVRGFVSVVGAGPGDPGLVTLKAQRRLQDADVILHDRLVPPAVLALARRDAVFIETGKRAGEHFTPQETIHQLMLEHARAGLRVVRLKGGDPFVFGRGGEELEFLRAHGIDYEVIPGVTAALACAAHAGIPLTHRDHAQSVRLLTAHCRDSLDTHDWQALAQERQTLAIYMGVAGLAAVRDALLAHGRDPETPFALVENGARPEQRVVRGSLRQLPEQARKFNVCSPALLILGEVAALSERLHWFGQAPIGCPIPEASVSSAERFADAA